MYIYKSKTALNKNTNRVLNLLNLKTINLSFKKKPGKGGIPATFNILIQNNSFLWLEGSSALLVSFIPLIESSFKKNNGNIKTE